ncbi:hypothetical protein [Thalassospira sp. MCCC 1A01428]|uniref:hypothetical protein n=1 Tax=Thalassospira sp. MCCC 1A01428 TaxID=1470575 RepID=UPI000A2285CC|nr:hypothetical protein [Thalassospira sp. MCCC 1A01428]OSQ44109.1 hypothetical protein THS27_07710 [Thalassospira sp. MCCC 1A01428]
MLKSDELKSWLHKDLTRLDKLLLVIATQNGGVGVSKIVEVAGSAGFRDVKKWNVSAILGGSKGKAIRTNGWELTDAGKTHLRRLGVSSVSPGAMQVAFDLRTHLASITDEQTRDFVEEAIRCYEAELYRSAVVMSWLGAMDVLQKFVHKRCLLEFNAEASRVNSKWKAAVSQDDIGKMGESDFLDRIEALSIIGKNVKSQLKACLDLRNGCGHPNSLKISVNRCAAHIEILLQNVFEKIS